MNFHDAVWSSKGLETKLRVQGMRVAGGEQYAAKALKLRVSSDVLHKAPSQTFASMLGENVNVGKVRESRLVRYHASKTHLFIVVENAEANGIGDRALDNGARNAGRPIGLRKEAVNRTYVETRFVTRDFIRDHVEFISLRCDLDFSGRHSRRSRPIALDIRERPVVVSCNLTCRQHAIVDGRVPIRHEHDGVSQCHGAPNGGVDAKLALQATDDQVGNATGRQEFAQPSAQKGVGRSLPQQDIGAVKLERRRELPGIGPVIHFATGRFMLNDNHKCTGSACFARHRVDSADDGLDITSLARACAKDVLNVNDEQGSWHELAT